MKQPTPIGQFGILTSILPAVIAQMCMEERGLDHDQWFSEHVDLRTRWMHANNPQWRKFLEAEHGRDQLYVWVNHWLDGYMQNPERYRQRHPHTVITGPKSTTKIPKSTKMKITYYRDYCGGYHGITDESPKGMSGCVYAGRGPAEHGPIETVKEQAYAVKQLQKWTQVENVPVEWLEAIGYESVTETASEPPETRRPVETVILDFVPWHGPILDEYMKDPLFWPLCIIIFVILYRFVRWLFV